MLDSIEQKGDSIVFKELTKEEIEFLEKQEISVANALRPKNGFSLLVYISSLLYNFLILTAKVNRLEKQLNEQNETRQKNNRR